MTILPYMEPSPLTRTRRINLCIFTWAPWAISLTSSCFSFPTYQWNPLRAVMRRNGLTLVKYILHVESEGGGSNIFLSHHPGIGWGFGVWGTRQTCIKHLPLPRTMSGVQFVNFDSFFFKKTLFIWERDKNKRRSRLPTEQGAQLGSNPGSWDHDPSWRQMLNWPSHPGAPISVLFLMFYFLLGMW